MLTDFGKKILSCEMAFATPTCVTNSDMTYTGGIYDKRGNLIPSAQRPNPIDTWTSSSPSRLNKRDPKITIERDCIYMGQYITHYGHFLLETLARFWALKHVDQDTTLVFHPFLRRKPIPPKRWTPIKISIESFGFKPKNVLFVKQPTCFQRLLVPTPALEYSVGADPEQSKVFSTIGEYCEILTDKPRLFSRSAALPYPKKIYLSRKYLHGKRLIENEAEVEGLFQSKGFTILYPEKTPFDTQVRYYRKAEVIAGFSGSATHNSLFASSGTEIITLGTSRDPHAPSINQQICNELSGARSACVPFQGQVVDPDRSLSHIDMSYLSEALTKLLGR